MPEYVQLCKHREETIDRVIADAGGKHAMSYTQHRGLAQVTYRAKLKFAAMNLKKSAMWNRKLHFHILILCFFCSEYARNPVAH